MRKYLFIALVAALAASCGNDDDPVGAAATPDLSALLCDPADYNPYDHPLDSAPDGGCMRLRVNAPWPLRKEFNDLNPVQLTAARALGIKPITHSSDIMGLRRPVVMVQSCPEYYVDRLTHSLPYLVPEAAELLADIGRSFNDSLAARGGGAYRIKVTSVLRTPETVRRLRRVNVNASGESTHQYGTTFDISYSKFVCDDASQPHRTFEDLKNLLAEVLHKLREEGRCYIKYEVKQSCFHITVRPSTSAANESQDPTQGA